MSTSILHRLTHWKAFMQGVELRNPIFFWYACGISGMWSLPRSIIASACQCNIYPCKNVHYTLMHAGIVNTNSPLSGHVKHYDNRTWYFSVSLHISNRNNFVIKLQIIIVNIIFSKFERDPTRTSHKYMVMLIMLIVWSSIIITINM